MNVGFVVQRYGREVNGGAEQECRDVAERMAKHWNVEVLTTCAVDYVTWRDEYRPGDEVLHDVRVRRFPVDAPRDLAAFNRLSERVFGGGHGRAEEEAWMRAQGPYSSPLLAHLRDHGADYDWIIYFTYLYATTYYGLALTGARSLLVPTAHDEPPIYLGIFRDMFRRPRAFMFNTAQEQAFVNRRFGTADRPQDVVAVGVEPDVVADAVRFRRAHGGRVGDMPFILYLGRIDPSKGCDHLFEYFQRYRREVPDRPVRLVLAGKPVMPVPESPDIVALGFVSDEMKFDALAAAHLAVVPSPYESLSIVALEAWHTGRPVLVNGRCEVLRAQCLRSNGGLWYDTYEEFREALSLLLDRAEVREALGRAGQRFVAEHYRWRVVEEKYRTMIDRLGRGAA